MEKYSIEEFVNITGKTGDGDERVRLERERFLEINLDGSVWTKMGSMVAYFGNIRFSREGVLEHGLGKLVKKTLTGEGMTLTRAEGEGKLYLADMGKKVSVINLEDQSIVVNGNDLLAFDNTLDWDIKLMKKITGMVSGGLFNVRLEGTGMVAITTHYDPLTLRVTGNESVFTDPTATVAWSGNLMPELKTDISMKTLLGRASGETIQMKFRGEGFVVIQPYEEIAFQASSSK
ncbi:protein of unknown function DUF124 [Methanosalsum zhilinae DSM 4017]|uniref:AIM24 family protein n=1 Tax=Methanosalsum zhilinae (strain DSM 4017 / NBRC 107636 / OCM 62 / WeN5) TaxID=679901 RepID=F7XM43_METZD|nr:AIM24 family protein [Methanosalsum zhilinae]AEH61390.1 protein of unknown function DUF124 [Methanosalsum zhilinae DSM 4017]